MYNATITRLFIFIFTHSFSLSRLSHAYSVINNRDFSFSGFPSVPFRFVVSWGFLAIFFFHARSGDRGKRGAQEKQQLVFFMREFSLLLSVFFSGGRISLFWDTRWETLRFWDESDMRA